MVDLVPDIAIHYDVSVVLQVDNASHFCVSSIRLFYSIPNARERWWGVQVFQLFTAIQVKPFVIWTNQR